MRTRYLVLSAVVLVLTLAGAAWAGGLFTAQTTDCCQLGLDCCDPPSECCLTAKAKTDCCGGDLPCCNPPSECCFAARTTANAKAVKSD